MEALNSGRLVDMSATEAGHWFAFVRRHRKLSVKPFPIEFENPYVRDAAGFWLEQNANTEQARAS